VRDKLILKMYLLQAILELYLFKVEGTDMLQSSGLGIHSFTLVSHTNPNLNDAK
jgi:hypothetical protein